MQDESWQCGEVRNLNGGVARWRSCFVLAGLRRQLHGAGTCKMARLARNVEGTHNGVSKTRHFTREVMWICMWLLVMPFQCRFMATARS